MRPSNPGEHHPRQGRVRRTLDRLFEARRRREDGCRHGRSVAYHPRWLGRPTSILDGCPASAWPRLSSTSSWGISTATPVVCSTRTDRPRTPVATSSPSRSSPSRSEEHTSELQSHLNLVCRLLLEKKKFEPNRPLIVQEEIRCTY